MMFQAAQRTLCFNQSQITSRQNGNVPRWNGPCHTLSATDAYPPTAAIMDKEDGTMPTGYVVRRLTPLECERLQGFPDGWTDIKRKCVKAKDGYKAVEVDETPDTPRYKALGNSMAVPCMLWIGKRIQMVEDGEL